MADMILAIVSNTAEMLQKDPINWARTEILTKMAVQKMLALGIDNASALRFLQTGLDDLFAFAILEKMRQQPQLGLCGVAACRMG